MKTGNAKGKINIVYANGETGCVSPGVLTALLAAGRVSAFERDTGWVVPGRDAIRIRQVPYVGENRRVA